MANIDIFLRYLTEHNGSDLHLGAESRPKIRLDGDLEVTTHEVLSNDALRSMLFEIISREQQELFLAEKELDFAYDIPDIARFRVNYFDQRKGISAVFRLIPRMIKSVMDLGLPSQIIKLTAISRGLVLVTGPTGSGKTTTISSLIDHINNTRKLHIITIEDPIEFIHDDKSCLVNQREIGSNTKSFARAAKSALREDPDVILLGELRDLETIELAITAAETGHVVFATVHTSSAAKTIDRVIDVFPASQQEQIRTMLSGSLKGVICQQLLKRMDMPGRVPVMEILFCNFAVANLIRENKIHQITSVIQAGKSQGMQLMDDEIMNIFNKKTISDEEAYLKANDKRLFEKIAERRYRERSMSRN